VRTQTTARLESERETYTPWTPAELPSLAFRAATIAERSDLVAGRAYEPPASATLAAVTASAIAAIAERRSERDPISRKLALAACAWR